MEVLMRTRLPGAIAAALLIVSGALAPAVQATAVPTVDGQTCIDGRGSVEYESTQDSWICVGGSYDGQRID
ncbi:hypothetical protein ADK94_21075 [Streptomyces sp. XY593]|nr:hypothetical protein ADK94_21075 [Streptomyces sp. XY593]KOU95493.1 hypothetical protein ADK91_36385 [Streptomyces sp. XY511]KOV07443.1 hypothetical protein ADK92_05300 [Streptomyces sp. XY533]KOV42455.1 hypothetical protein ADK98_23965 [Streptomyces sp. H036]